MSMNKKKIIEGCNILFLLMHGCCLSCVWKCGSRSSSNWRLIP